MVSEIADKSDLLTLFLPINKKVTAVLSDSGIKSGTLYDTLRYDPAISLLLLRAANSKTEGLHNSVSSIKLAINILGIDKVSFLNKTVRTLAPQMILPSDLISSHDFWRHSLTVALISETIAKHIKRFAPINPDNLFCAALFHDLGIVAIARHSVSAIEDIITKSIEEKLPYCEAEDELKHAETGAEILRLWGIPEKIYGPIWYHHNPSSTQKYTLSAAVVHVADVTAQLIGMPLFEKEIVPQIDSDALKLIGLSPERLNVIARDAMDTVVSLEKEFKIN